MLGGRSHVGMYLFSCILKLSPINRRLYCQSSLLDYPMARKFTRASLCLEGFKFGVIVKTSEIVSAYPLASIICRRCSMFILGKLFLTT